MALATMVVVAMLLALVVHWVVGVLAGIVGLLVITTSAEKKKEVARKMCSPQCMTPQRAVDYAGWSGTIHMFDIVSEGYAVAFLRANRSKIVNLSPEVAGKLNEALPMTLMTASAGSPAGAPGRTKPAPSSDDVLLKWVQKVEAARGPAARRASVEIALKDPALADRRDDFIKAAARIEVSATMDKVDGLKTAAAKKRHLLDAVSALRGDSAPDELQQAEIQCLEDAIRDIDGTP